MSASTTNMLQELPATTVPTHIDALLKTCGCTCIEDCPCTSKEVREAFNQKIAEIASEFQKSDITLAYVGAGNMKQVISATARLLERGKQQIHWVLIEPNLLVNPQWESCWDLYSIPDFKRETYKKNDIPGNAIVISHNNTVHFIENGTLRNEGFLRQNRERFTIKTSNIQQSVLNNAANRNEKGKINIINENRLPVHAILDAAMKIDGKDRINPNGSRLLTELEVVLKALQQKHVGSSITISRFTTVFSYHLSLRKDKNEILSNEARFEEEFSRFNSVYKKATPDHYKNLSYLRMACQHDQIEKTLQTPSPLDMVVGIDLAAIHLDKFTAGIDSNSERQCIASVMPTNRILAYENNQNWEETPYPKVIYVRGNQRDVGNNINIFTNPDNFMSDAKRGDQMVVRPVPKKESPLVKPQGTTEAQVSTTTPSVNTLQPIDEQQNRNVSDKPSNPETQKTTLPQTNETSIVIPTVVKPQKQKESTGGPRDILYALYSSKEKWKIQSLSRQACNSISEASKTRYRNLEGALHFLYNEALIQEEKRFKEKEKLAVTNCYRSIAELATHAQDKEALNRYFDEKYKKNVSEDKAVNRTSHLLYKLYNERYLSDEQKTRKKINQYQQQIQDNDYKIQNLKRNIIERMGHQRESLQSAIVKIRERLADYDKPINMCGQDVDPNTLSNGMRTMSPRGRNTYEYVLDYCETILPDSNNPFLLDAFTKSMEQANHPLSRRAFQESMNEVKRNGLDIETTLSHVLGSDILSDINYSFSDHDQTKTDIEKCKQSIIELQEKIVALGGTPVTNRNSL